jgi:transaldolase
MNTIQKTYEHGQAIWLDDIRRSYFTSGKLQELIDLGLKGMTSNPTIFEKAISGSADYDEALTALVAAGLSVEQIYDELTRADIAAAADLLRPVHEQTKGTDGYVSLEVNPRLANNTAATIEEALRLFSALDRPNIMIKVPGTPEGIPAIEHLIGEGVNVNVTLLFSIDRYREAARAYIVGLEKRDSAGQPVAGIASVASFFVSRIDGMVDQELGERDQDELAGKTAISNAKLAYREFGHIFSGQRWEKLQSVGAGFQRPLWASTSTKNPSYPDTLYVDSLIGPHTVNTLPMQTLEAFLDHGTPAVTLSQSLEEADGHMEHLDALGIDIDRVTDSLLVKGVQSFSASFDSLLEGIEKKVNLLKGDQ